MWGHVEPLGIHSDHRATGQVTTHLSDLHRVAEAAREEKVHAGRVHCVRDTQLVM